jgi:hypothetical protein
VIFGAKIPRFRYSFRDNAHRRCPPPDSRFWSVPGASTMVGGLKLFMLIGAIRLGHRPLIIYNSRKSWSQSRLHGHRRCSGRGVRVWCTVRVDWLRRFQKIA